MVRSERISWKFAAAAFISGLVMFIAVMLPDLIKNGGVMIMTGDVMKQGIPFTYRIYDALKDLPTGWDMRSGLGGDTLTNYAFYGLFSPFSLPYLLLPRDILVYAIPYVTALKYGAGSLFACCYISRHTDVRHYAVIGGMVYMFSSFSAYNTVFHFTDAIALFPLFLTALDELCENRRKGVFALSCALMALTNYYFFFGQAVFAVIYFCCRYISRDVKGTLRRLGMTALEAAAGTMLAGAVLLPVAGALLQSPKATGFMDVQGMFFYNSIFKYLRIIQSIFSVPDGFALDTLFPETDSTYPFGTLMASVAAYLPFFSAAGVISYCFASRKATWEKALFAVCTVFAFVPVLNQSFSAFNSAYYARWYYMPMLAGSAVSVKALERGISFKPGIIACGSVLGGLILYRALYNEQWFFDTTSNSAVFNSPLGIIDLAAAAISLVLLIAAVCGKRDREFIPKLYIFSYIGIYLCFGIMQFYNLTAFAMKDPTDKHILADMYVFGERLPETVDTGLRMAVPMSAANFNLVWGADSPVYFNSLHDPGFREFLEASDMVMNSGVYSVMDEERHELADLASVKYYLITPGKREKYSSFVKTADFSEYLICENPNYIPMGFTYDRTLSRAAFDSIPSTEEKHRAYLKYLIADDPEQFSDILPVSSYSPVSDSEYSELIEQRRSECAYNTVFSKDGITASIDLSRENIVFFSISHNSGWKAFVDGTETDVLKVNNGLVGIRVPAGTHSIELRYRTPLLTEGIAASAAGAVILILWLLLPKFIKKIKAPVTA